MPISRPLGSFVKDCARLSAKLVEEQGVLWDAPELQVTVYDRVRRDVRWREVASKVEALLPRPGGVRSSRAGGGDIDSRL